MTTEIKYNDIPIREYFHWLKRSWFMSKQLHRPVMVDDIYDSDDETLVCYTTDKKARVLPVTDLDIRLPTLGYKNLIIPNQMDRRRKRVNKKERLDINNMFLPLRPHAGPHPYLKELTDSSENDITKVAAYLSYNGKITYKKGFASTVLSEIISIFDTTLRRTVHKYVSNILTDNSNIENIFNTGYPKLIDALYGYKPKGYQTALSENFAIASIDLGIRNPIYNYVLMYRGRVIGFLSKLYGQSSFKSRVKLHDSNKYLLPLLIEEFKQDSSVKFI